MVLFGHLLQAGLVLTAIILAIVTVLDFINEGRSDED